MSVGELRDIFIQKVYVPLLKPFFAARLEAGRLALENSQLTVVLLSGGSANFGWLRQLLLQDFPEDLRGVPFVQIADFQQVVAQGLAVDCAREFASGVSDFRGVTYNPLYLLLNPDGSECEPWGFIARSPGLPEVKNRPGLLLPSASVVNLLIDQPLEWRVKLNRPPRRKLEYYFLQSSMDVSDVRNLQNVEETVLHTPARCEFDSALFVRLTIRSDGTVIPQFVYQSGGPGREERMKEERKFAIDMTDAGGNGGEAYIGLDFGTSNTAISYVDRSWVQIIESRNASPSWRELGELVDLLPGPLAIPLARYIGDHSQSGPVPPGYSFIESALCICAYISLIEFCTSARRSTTRIFRQFPHRSASTIWLMLKAVQEQLGKSAYATGPLKPLFTPANSALMDRITIKWAQERHELVQSDRDEVLNAVRLLANCANGVFGRYKFGYIEAIQKERFSNKYVGRFRVAHGKPPYTSFLAYSGSQTFSEAEALLVDTVTGQGFILTPLVFWYPCQGHPDSDNGHCFVFDKLKGEELSAIATYKAASSSCQIATTSGSDMTELLQQLVAFKSEDLKLFVLEGLVFSQAAD